MQDILKQGVKPIRNNREYQAVLKMIEENWDPKPGTPQADLFEILCLLVEAYEQREFKVKAAYDPIDVIHFWVEQKGFTRKDLEIYLGPRGRVAEVLNRKRPLSLAMIRNLVEAGIPAHMLIGKIRLRTSSSGEKKRNAAVPRTHHAHP